MRPPTGDWGGPRAGDRGRRTRCAASSWVWPVRHGAPGESEHLGGGEPGLLPAPGLQQTHVSPPKVPPLSSLPPVPSARWLSSSLSLDPEACRRGTVVLWAPSGEGEDELFRVLPPLPVPLSGDSALGNVALMSDNGWGGPQAVRDEVAGYTPPSRTGKQSFCPK
jgi:hypothetical protein